MKHYFVIDSKTIQKKFRALYTDFCRTSRPAQSVDMERDSSTSCLRVARSQHTDLACLLPPSVCCYYKYSFVWYFSLFFFFFLVWKNFHSRSEIANPISPKGKKQPYCLFIVYIFNILIATRIQE